MNTKTGKTAQTGVGDADLRTTAAVAHACGAGMAGGSRTAVDGAGREIRFAVGRCLLGAVLLARSERGICAILMGEDPRTLAQDLRERFPQAVLIGNDPDAMQAVSHFAACLAAPGQSLPLAPLDVRGTVFQQRVWSALRAIPAGQTASYSDIAERIGAPKAVRAVARACAANALAVAIPCHRVLRRDGSLSGYRWGVDRKRQLLALEAQA